MGLKISIDGLSKTLALVRRAGETETAAGRRMVKRAASLVQEKAMRTVPVYTGTLKRSIIIDIAPNGLSGTVTATADYAAYVEYGTRKMSARPFMRTAAEQAISVLADECRDAAKDAAREAAR